MGGGLVLTGVLAASQLRLYPTRLFLMNKVVYPLTNFLLSWTGSEPSKVTVSAEAPDWIKVVHPPLTATVACDAVSLDSVASPRVSEVLFGQKSGRFHQLPTGRFVEVYGEIGKPADVRVFFSSSMVAESFKFERGFTFVTIEQDQMVVAGWVRSQNLKPMDSGLGHLGPLSGGVGWTEASRSPIAKVVCSTSVPVVAEVSGESARVGEVLGGTVIEILEKRGDFSRIFVSAPGVRITRDATLLARTAELAACRPSQ